MAKRSMFVGMDVHKESIDVSRAQEGRDGEVRRYEVIPGDLEAVAKVVRALRAPNRRLRFVYEAGPCGFGLHRYLTGQGEDCVVVNPSSLPKRSGDRIKTDRRDGAALARLHRAGELTAIYIPTPDDEALRDLVRAREDAVGLSTQAKHRLNAFLLRQGRRYPGRGGWTRPYRRWLADLSFPLGPQHIALQEYCDTIDETERRVERLTDQLRQQTPVLSGHTKMTPRLSKSCPCGVKPPLNYRTRRVSVGLEQFLRVACTSFRSSPVGFRWDIGHGL